jgi:hypothetical protein
MLHSQLLLSLPPVGFVQSKKFACSNSYTSCPSFSDQDKNWPVFVCILMQALRSDVWWP